MRALEVRVLLLDPQPTAAPPVLRGPAVVAWSYLVGGWSL